MAFIRRLVVARLTVVVCSILALSLPVFLLYEREEEYVFRPRMPDTRPYRGQNQHIRFRQTELQEIQQGRRRTRSPDELSGGFIVEFRHLAQLSSGDDYEDAAEEHAHPENLRDSLITLSPEVNRILDEYNLSFAQEKNSHPSKILQVNLHQMKSTYNYEKSVNLAQGSSTLSPQQHHSYDNVRHDPLFQPKSRTELESESTNGTCKEIQQVAFLKTHKTGSTTVMNVVQRFGHVRNLVIALPKSGNYLGFGTSIQLDTLLPPPRGKTYDMIINHVVYNRNVFSLVLPHSTSIYVTIIREPFSQLVSAIEYLKYSVTYLKKLPRSNTVSAFLSDPVSQESKDYKWSFTNNRMSFDLGLNRTLYHNEATVQKFIAELDEDFKLVMILEHMDESLVLMKRYLCWSLKDILYISRNVNPKKAPYSFTKEDKDRHKQWAFADYKLYDFFYERFWKQIQAEGPQFFQEVRVFKETLSTVKEFCTSRMSTAEMIIQKTAWNDQFAVSKTDCEYMLLDEVRFLLQTRNKHLENLRGSGYKNLPKPALIGRYAKPVRRSYHPGILRRHRTGRPVRRRHRRFGNSH